MKFMLKTRKNYLQIRLKNKPYLRYTVFYSYRNHINEQLYSNTIETTQNTL